MAMKKNKVVVGVFQERSQAEQAIDALRRAGFRSNQIGVVSRDKKSIRGIKSNETMAEEGGATGAAVGLGAGALAGLGVLSGVIPVIGPAIAAGTLGVILSNAALGAAAGGLIGALVGLGIPEEDAEFYQKELKAGRTIVTVKNAARADEALEILRRYEGYDYATFREQKAASRGGRTTATTTAQSGQVMQLKEEELTTHKQPVKKGEVRVRKDVITEHRTIDMPVTREEVVVERRPARGRAATGPVEGSREIRIPVTEEEVRVQKRPVVKEEVAVGKRQVRDTQRVGGTVRREEVKVEEQGNVKVRRNGGRCER